LLSKLFRSPEKLIPPEDFGLAENIKKITGYHPKKTALFREAITHSSENKKNRYGKFFNYERLEFLGDAVIGLVVAEYLYKHIPRATEGKLTEMRAKIVSRKNLNRLGEKMKLYRLINRKKKQKLGKNILGNLVEAIAGAIYLDGGYPEAKKFVEKKILDGIDLTRMENIVQSYKNKMVIWGQKHKIPVKFVTKEEKNEASQVIYFTELFIENQRISTGKSPTKKQAEETAAKNAYKQLKQEGRIH